MDNGEADVLYGKTPQLCGMDGSDVFGRVKFYGERMIVPVDYFKGVGCGTSTAKLSFCQVRGTSGSPWSLIARRESRSNGCAEVYIVRLETDHGGVA